MKERAVNTLITGTASVKNGDISFNSPEFVDNLILIDSTMPGILAYMLKEHIQSREKSLRALTEMCAEANICGIKSRYYVPLYYIKKVKDFLYAVLHGLSFNEPWDGKCVTKPLYILGGGMSFSTYERGTMLDYVYRTARIATVHESKDGNKVRVRWEISV